jgi:beta-aspartyl-peptidase (threonine type)
VGDSPLVGSGGYADNQSGAVSTTGHGESIIKVLVSFQTLLLISFM